MNLELRSLFNKDSTTALEKPDIDVDIRDYDVRPMTFLNINAFNSYFWTNGVEYTEIHSNGQTYLCIDDYASLKSKIATSQKRLQ